MIFTFLGVLFVTMLKEAYEDYGRKKSDTELNNNPCWVQNPITKVFEDRVWSEIRIGDIVKVEKDNEVPADLLLITAPKDIVFVSTMNLDGETNLKDRELAVTTVKEKHLGYFTGHIVCDSPNASLDAWEGNLAAPDQLRKSAPNGVKHCNIKNLLLRGCTLKNTHYCYGIAVYVGHNTKIMKNQKNPPRKISNMMKKMNYMLYTVFAFQFMIICLWSSLSMAWMQEHRETHKYLDIQGSLGPGRWFI